MASSEVVAGDKVTKVETKKPLCSQQASMKDLEQFSLLDGADSGGARDDGILYPFFPHTLPMPCSSFHTYLWSSGEENSACQE